MPGIASFLGFSKPPVAKQPTEQEEPDAKTQFQKMIDREELEVNIEMELDSDIESDSVKPLPICAICKKSDKHDHEECAKKYNPMDRGYYDDEGGFVEYTPPHYFVKEAQRLSQDPGPEGQHYRALQAYKKSMSQVELYLAAKQETYGESAKGNGSDLIVDLETTSTMS